MYWSEINHSLPHFHAYYTEYKASFDLAGKVGATRQARRPRRDLESVRVLLERLRERMQARAKTALSVVKSFSIAGPGGIRLQLDVDAAPGTADTGDIEQDLTDLLVEIGEVVALTRWRARQAPAGCEHQL